MNTARTFLRAEIILKWALAGVAILGLFALAFKATYEAWRNPFEALVVVMIALGVIGSGALLDDLHARAKRRASLDN